MKRIILSLILVLAFIGFSIAEPVSLQAADISVDFKTANTKQEKQTYIVELEELVFEEHRTMGARKRAGEITEAAFRTYEREVFGSKMIAISKAKYAEGLQATSEADATTKSEAEQVIKAQMIISPQWPNADAVSSFKE